MPNTILYYPKIAIPNSVWLRQALLYWDKVGSIIPREFDQAVQTDPDLRMIHQLGVYRPYNPEVFILGDPRVREEFENEFIALTKIPDFWKSLPPSEARTFDTDIHIAKITDRLSQYIQRKRLAITEHPHGHWFKFEETSASLYMSLLAKYIADSTEETIPGTDSQSYKDLIFHTEKPDFSSSCLQLSLQDILPVPSLDNPLEKILEFKAKRRDELISFREIIWGIQNDLKNAREIQEITAIVSRYSDLIPAKTSALSKTMHEEKLQLWRGSLESLIKVDIFPALGLVFDPFQIPIEYKLAGLGVMGVITVSNYLLDRRNERRRFLRENSFSYLYHARQEGLF